MKGDGKVKDGLAIYIDGKLVFHADEEQAPALLKRLENDEVEMQWKPDSVSLRYNPVPIKDSSLVIQQKENVTIAYDIEKEPEFYVDLNYPRSGRFQEIVISLVDVRAADDISIRFDFDRDGWVISQPREFYREDKESGIYNVDAEYLESYFAPAWKYELEEEKKFNYKPEKERNMNQIYRVQHAGKRYLLCHDQIFTDKDFKTLIIQYDRDEEDNYANISDYLVAEHGFKKLPFFAQFLEENNR